MKRLLSLSNAITVSAVIAALSTVSAPALAAKNQASSQRFTEYAKVINVQPIYRQVTLREPTQQCWTEQEQIIVGYQQDNRYSNQRQNSTSAGNAIVGGLIGGVIGNQIGRGTNRGSRTGATVVGAIIGSAIGNETGNQTSSRHRRFQESSRNQSTPIYETRNVERCKRVVESRTESQLQHYDVTYQYKGRKFVTQLPRDPGNRIEIQVSVAPARR